MARGTSIAIAAMALLSVASALTNPASAKVRVVASFSILADITRQIGGDDVEVSALVGPNGDAHVYDPRPRDAEMLKSSNLMIINGLGFEGWLTRLVSSSGFQGRVVTASKDIQPLMLKGSYDPHAWQSLSNAHVYVLNITNALCATSPGICSKFKQRAADYDAKISELDRELRTEFSLIPEQNRRIFTSHDAFGYFAAAYGITFTSVQGVSTEADASAGDIASIIRDMRSQGVKTVFMENVSDPRLMKMISRESEAKLGGELYSDALSGPDGPAKTYLDLMRYNAGLFLSAMKGK